MNNLSKYFATSVCVATLLISNLASAHEGGQANAGYVGDMTGHLVMDGSGNCLRTIDYNKEKYGLAECGDAPAKKVVKHKPMPAPTPAPKTVVRETLTLDSHALFNTNENNLRPGGIARLNAIATKLRSYYSLSSIVIVGHTDSHGTEAYNQALSERRAEAVEAFIISKGVSSNLIRTSGAGETSPVASNTTATGRQENRRVEIKITAQKIN